MDSKLSRKYLCEVSFGPPQKGLNIPAILRTMTNLQKQMTGDTNSFQFLVSLALYYATKARPLQSISTTY